ncbi:uncharacterized protein METZ01_LOCUS282282 [marine metagenome]|uniref:M23ase beta-sheet core domain-containing protein n=1 Tax=marine metagenome TaxID=408172 RepID=A0A382KXS0_9ZZZZ
MNNKYSIAIFNNLKHKTYAINISKSALLVLLTTIIIFMIYSINIIYLFHNKTANTEIQKLNVLEPKLNTFIAHLIENQIVNDTILKEFNLLDHHVEYTNLVPVAMPVIGFVSKGIETKKLHNGIDIACTFNAKVHATQKGLIVFSDELKILGKTIIIAHPNQFFSLYAHLNKSIVSAQTYVDKNQIIGFAGESGDSDGPHLHFEIWKNHNIIDPRNLIEEYRIKDVSIR